MKRRAAPRSGKDALLPMTTADAENQSRRRRPPGSIGGGASSFYPFCVCVTLVAALVVFVVVMQGYHNKLEKHANYLYNHPIKKKFHKKIRDIGNKLNGKHSTHEDIQAPSKLTSKQFERKEQEKPQEELELYQYSYLRYPLLNSKIVLLYFAASWCPMSTPVTNQLDSLFRALLLPPVPLLDDGNVPRTMKRHGASLVYVSSDKSQDSMEDYQKENWMVIPFNSPDRQNLKKRFRTCAKIELETLGMEDRDREIPALIIISGETHQVLTYDGVDDVKQKGGDAMSYWLGLVEEQEDAPSSK